MRVCVVVSILLSFLVGCTSMDVPAVPLPTAVPSPVPDPRGAAVLATMERYEDLFAQGSTGRAEDLATITTSLPLQRYYRERLRFAPPPEAYERMAYRVVQIWDRPHGLIEVEFLRSDQRHLRLFFRASDQGWLISEPTADELGTQVWYPTLHLALASYPWVETTEMITVLAEEAYAQVAQFFGPLPADPPALILLPAFGMVPGLGVGTLALYRDGREPTLLVSVPGAVNFPAYESADGWQTVVREVIAHELTHWAHDTLPGIPQLDRVPEWFSEGLAEYVAAPLRVTRARELRDAGAWLPLVAPDRRDLLRMEELSGPDRGAAYVQAQFLVAYLARTDLQDAWDVITVYMETPGVGAERLDQALRTALDMDRETFAAAWEAWVVEQLASPAVPGGSVLRP